jgi:membrane protein
VAGFREHDCVTLAAAVGFYCVLAVIPLLLLGTSILGFVVGSSRAAGEIVAWLARLSPGAGRGEIETFLAAFAARRRIAGGLGLAGLAWVASGVFEVIERAVNRILGFDETRSWLRRKLVALLMMLSAGVLLLIALTLPSLPLVLRLLPEGVAETLPLELSVLWDPIVRNLPVLLVMATFAMVYAVAPAETLPMPAAIAAGVAGGLLWQAAKLAFDWFAARVAGYSRLYGVLGGFMALLLWIYYTALILLLGAELIAARRR